MHASAGRARDSLLWGKVRYVADVWQNGYLRGARSGWYRRSYHDWPVSVSTLSIPLTPDVVLRPNTAPPHLTDLPRPYSPIPSCLRPGSVCSTSVLRRPADPRSFAQSSVAANDGFSQIDGGWLDHNWVQLGKQVAWACVGLSWTFVVTYAIMFVINLIPGCKFRATMEAEIVGMDVSAIGAPLDLFPLTLSACCHDFFKSQTWTLPGLGLD